MKKFKKVMVGAVAATLAVSSLTGCGNDKEKETETEKKTEKESETATVETTEKETTKSGESEEFLIGGMGPLTGAAASYGNSVKQTLYYICSMEEGKMRLHGYGTGKSRI